MKETFIKKYTVERTNKPEIKLEEQWQRGELSVEFMERNTVERAIKTEMDTRTEKIRSGQALLVYVFDINHDVHITGRRARGEHK